MRLVLRYTGVLVYWRCGHREAPARAMEPAGWSEDQLQEAAEHEVNRMGYRLNLEILDQLMNQFSNTQRTINSARMSRAARRWTTGPAPAGGPGWKQPSFQPVAGNPPLS